jgi:acetyl-CoA acetyltransferase
MRELGLDEARVNVNGGAIALGHPLGASGARLVGTLAHELRRSGERWGLATLCIGVGQGLAVVIENPEGTWTST